jgi:uncharacterized membrane protein YjgN (DUF898 family)
MSLKNKLTYKGKLSTLYSIWLTNIILKIVTLGIYSFWAKTRMRKYNMRQIILAEERFKYSGKGLELFFGFLKTIAVLVVLYILLFVLPAKFIADEIQKNIENLENINFIIFYLIVAMQYVSAFTLTIWLTYFGSYAAARYRANKTSWRGIRFRQKGSAAYYASLKIARSFLNIITLGYLIPHSDMVAYNYRMSNLHFGILQAEFKKSLKGLIKCNLITLLLAIPTFGISRIWYNAKLMRHICASTRLGPITFKSTQSGSNLFALYAVNFFILLFTFGLGMPLVIKRTISYYTKHLVVIGDLNELTAGQSTEEALNSGEGLEGILSDPELGFI